MKKLGWAGLLVMALALVAGGLALTAGDSALAQDSELGPVVFASDRTGNYEVFVLNPQTGLSTQLTNNPAMDIEPVWSPDGEYIVFASDRDGDFEIYVMRADGTDVQQLTRNNFEDRQPRWQPDDDYIVYVSNANGQFDIYAVTADGAVVRQLTNDPADERGPGAGPEPGTSVTSVPPSPTAIVFTPTSALPDGVVDTFRLNVRSNPGEGAQIIGQVVNDDPLDIIGRRFDNSWLQVITPSGQRGWVYAPLVNVNIDLATVPVVDAQFIAPPPTATPTPLPPTANPVVITFTTDRTTIAPGECANLSWTVSGIREVYFQGEGVVGTGTRQVCPAASTTYNLRVILQDGTVDNRYITINVLGS